MSLAGAIADARKSATRLYINNFADKGRQNTIDLLLVSLMKHVGIKIMSNEYTSSRSVHFWVGTFNLNGRANGAAQDLSPWLCPELDRLHQQPEIVAVGFQEIVELSPLQIMSTDPDRRQEWELAVRKTLNGNARKHNSEEYVLLRSGQLVGAALLIFVKPSILGDIKNVEGSVRKTGMSGMAGNKGSVAIRMDYASTRLCFVTAHLAAGFANYEERNRDYRTINHGLRFQRNRSIEDHDTIIWLGDFNYRIGLSDDRVRRLIHAGDIDTLYQNDQVGRPLPPNPEALTESQLNLQMVAGLTFPFYSEARITFMPTYKYDNGTDNYDSSKGDNLRQMKYSTASLRFSDHRPVYAIFQCTISVVNESVKEGISREIYEKRRSEVGEITANSKGIENDDDDLIGYDAIAPGLPPASSDRRKWWLDNSK
ncbi:MAG: hypothetical protein LQ347_001963 [Umbilicaria vellea]|nr:MAG: hypothetical protein LQ347_001963 [Umbilicaria vellea]